jgi:uncharacterized membrane protein YheB (UPF0754 family)
MDISSVLHFLAGPAIGGVIGYCTNFIAIKMLFRPREAVKIGKYTLPFTPGIIPKRKNSLAREIGETVAYKMFTSDDIEKIFLSPGMRSAIADCVMHSLHDQEEGELSLNLFLQEIMDETDYEEFQKKLDYFLEKKVYLVVNKADMADRISYESRKILREMARERNLMRVLGANQMESISDYMGSHLQSYAREHADTLIMPLLRTEVANFLVTPITQFLADTQTSEEQLKGSIEKAYEKFILKYKEQIVQLFDIASLTEERIIELEAEEIEELVNRTIHREMQSVINLGAVLGIIIGLVNSFI